MPFQRPTSNEWGARLGNVLHVLYLIFNEGYTSSFGPDLQRSELADEAIRLTRMVYQLLPADAEVAGLLALLLLTDARRRARSGPDGELIPLDEQDRSLWDAAQIAEGVALISAALPRGAVGPYQLQAAIAAIHDEAARAEDTDWPQILALYSLLERMLDNPMVMLNRAIALAMVHGPQAGLERLDRARLWTGASGPSPPRCGARSPARARGRPGAPALATDARPSARPAWQSETTCSCTRRG